MRIYAVADIHGKSSRIECIQSNVVEYKPDVLVVAGDITTFRGGREVIKQLDRLGLPVLAMRGNTDLPGSKGLYRFTRKYQPRLLLCGHIHENAGTATISNTIVVNCNIARNNAGAIIEMAENDAPIVQMI